MNKVLYNRMACVLVALALLACPSVFAGNDISIASLSPKQRDAYFWLVGKTFEGKWAVADYTRTKFTHRLTFTELIDLGNDKFLFYATESGKDRHLHHAHMVIDYEWASQVYVDHEAVLEPGQILCLTIRSQRVDLGRVGSYCLREVGGRVRLEGPYTYHHKPYGRLSLKSEERFETGGSESAFATD